MGAALALLLGFSLPVSAQSYLNEERKYRSPQHFALELRFGPYRPDVDSEFSTGRTPYRDYFGGNRRLMSQIELDYQLLRFYGSLGIGLGVGYFSVTGNAPEVSGSGVLTGDKSTFRVIPVSLSAVYRFDWLNEFHGIPLVPYGKAGLDYGYWSITDGNDEIATDNAGGKGRGGTPGWHVAAGLSVVLDFIDPDSARGLDDEMGVNHTHLFIELGHYDLSGFGRSGQLHVGDTTWTAGLLFEF
jgi:hypothetical protein